MQASQFIVSCCDSIYFQNYSLPQTAGVFRLQCARVPFQAAIYGDPFECRNQLPSLKILGSFQCTGANSCSIFIDILQSLGFTLGTIVIYLYTMLPYSMVGLSH